MVPWKRRQCSIVRPAKSSAPLSFARESRAARTEKQLGVRSVAVVDGIVLSVTGLFINRLCVALHCRPVVEGPLPPQAFVALLLFTRGK